MENLEIDKIFDDLSDVLEMWGNNENIDDVEMYKKMIEKFDGVVVELGIGDGRVAQVTKPTYGVDFSIKMLEKCKSRMKDNTPTLIHSNLTNYKLPKRANFSYSALNTFNHIVPQDRLEVLNNIFNNTESGGYYVFDSVLPDINKIKARNNSLVLRNKTDSFVIYGISRIIDSSNNGVELTFFLEELNNHSEVVRKKYFPPIPFYYILPHEYKTLINNTKWIIEDIYGGFNKELLGIESQVQIYVLRKP